MIEKRRRNRTPQQLRTYYGSKLSVADIHIRTDDQVYMDIGHPVKKGFKIEAILFVSRRTGVYTLKEIISWDQEHDICVFSFSHFKKIHEGDYPMYKMELGN